MNRLKGVPGKIQMIDGKTRTEKIKYIRDQVVDLIFEGIKGGKPMPAPPSELCLLYSWADNCLSDDKPDDTGTQ